MKSFAGTLLPALLVADLSAQLNRRSSDVCALLLLCRFQPVSCKLVHDRGSGASQGFGFVLFDSQDEGQAAIDALNHKDVEGEWSRSVAAKGTSTTGSFDDEWRPRGLLAAFMVAVTCY